MCTFIQLSNQPIMQQHCIVLNCANKGQELGVRLTLEKGKMWFQWLWAWHDCCAKWAGLSISVIEIFWDFYMQIASEVYSKWSNTKTSSEEQLWGQKLWWLADHWDQGIMSTQVGWQNGLSKSDNHSVQLLWAKIKISECTACQILIWTEYDSRRPRWVLLLLA